MGLSFKDIEMNNMRGLIVNVDSLGRIVIPKPLRDLLGLDETKKVEIYLLNDGCFFCAPREKKSN